MRKLYKYLPKPCRLWIEKTEAVAAVESALIFPILLTMLMGMFDAGYGVLAAQKTIRASQVTADLIARNKQVSSSDVDDAISGGMLALTPFNTSSFGVDIVSIQFDEDNNPLPIWCETRNMTSNPDALSDVQNLGGPGEGIIVVTVRYDYQPTFAGFIFDTIQMQEVSYVRGRLSSTVTHEEGNTC